MTPPRVAASSEPVAPPVPRLLARERELEPLEAALRQATTERGSVLLVSGQAGQGKTALLTSFATRAQELEPDLLVGIGTCNAYTGSGDPFHPFREILLQLTGDVALGTDPSAFEQTRASRLWRFMGRGGRALIEHGPHLLDRLVASRPLRSRLLDAGVSLPGANGPAAHSSPTSLSEGQGAYGQEALRSEIIAVLTALAQQAPLLLLLDDLQWADGSSLELLLQLGRTVPRHPILLVGAFRPADVAPTPEGRRHPLESVLNELTRLSGDAARIDLDLADGRAFVNAFLDAEPNRLDARFREALLQQTAGQPLFTIELLRALQERGDLVRDDDERWTQAASMRWDALPARVAGAIAERIARLEPATREALRAASVEGDVFTVEVVARVVERDPRAVVREVAGALDRHELVAGIDVRRAPRGLVSRYRFRHELIQRFLYDQLDESERAYLHEAVAEALKAVLGDEADPGALAFHYLQAHAPQRAAPHLRSAGDRARRSAALAEAVDFYTRALSAWPEQDATGRATLLRDLGECEWLRGRLERAENILGQARAAFDALGDHAAASTVQLSLGRVYYELGDFERSLQASMEALAMFDGQAETEGLARAQSTVSQLHMLASNDAEALHWGRRALDLAERLHADDIRTHALNNVGIVVAHSGSEHHDEGLGMLEQSWRLADRLGLAHDGCRALYNRAALLQAFGRVREAEAAWRHLIDYAQNQQILVLELSARLALSKLEWDLGRWSDTHQQLDRLYQHKRGFDGPGGNPKRVRVGLALASAELDLGRVGHAQTILLEHRSALERLDEEQLRAPYLRDRLRAAAASGESSEADACARALLDTVTAHPTHSEDVLAPLLTAVRWLSTHPATDTGSLLEASLRAAEVTEAQYGSADAGATLAAVRATAAGAAGDGTAAATLWLRAAELWRDCGFVLNEARARCVGARALAHAGRDADAGQARDRARALLADLESRLPTPELVASFARVQATLLSSAESTSA